MACETTQRLISASRPYSSAMPGERGRAQQFAVVLRAQVGLVQLQRLALQVQHRLVVQLEAVAGQCFTDTGDPAQHAFFLDAVGRSRVEDAAGIAQFGGGMRALAGACEHWPMLAIFSPTCTPPMLTVTVAERAPMLNTCAAYASRMRSASATVCA